MRQHRQEFILSRSLVTQLSRHRLVLTRAVAFAQQRIAEHLEQFAAQHEATLGDGDGTSRERPQLGEGHRRMSRELLDRRRVREVREPVPGHERSDDLVFESEGDADDRDAGRGHHDRRAQAALRETASSALLEEIRGEAVPREEVEERRRMERAARDPRLRVGRHGELGDGAEFLKCRTPDLGSEECRVAIVSSHRASSASVRAATRSGAREMRLRYAANGRRTPAPRTLGSTRMPSPSAISTSCVTRRVGFARILATVRPSRKISPNSIQFSRMMLSTSELIAKSPIIEDIPRSSGFSWLYPAAVWYSFISATSAWKKSRNT